MQFYPPFSSFFSTFGVKAANGINKMFKFSPHKGSFLKPRELECVIFFSKIMNLLRSCGYAVIETGFVAQYVKQLK